MLIFFFILIFIAEVKITYDVVCFIKRLDTKVCEINDKICEINPVIESSFTSLRIGLNKALLTLNKVQQKIREKKEKYKIILAKNVITGILFLILNSKFQKIFSVVDLICDVKDFYKKWSAIA